MIHLFAQESVQPHPDVIALYVETERVGETERLTLFAYSAYVDKTLIHTTVQLVNPGLDHVESSSAQIGEIFGISHHHALLQLIRLLETASSDQSIVIGVNIADTIAYIKDQANSNDIAMSSYAPLIDIVALEHFFNPTVTTLADLHRLYDTIADSKYENSAEYCKAIYATFLAITSNEQYGFCDIWHGAYTDYFSQLAVRSDVDNELYDTLAQYLPCFVRSDGEDYRLLDGRFVYAPYDGRPVVISQAQHLTHAASTLSKEAYDLYERTISWTLTDANIDVVGKLVPPGQMNYHIDLDINDCVEVASPKIQY